MTWQQVVSSTWVLLVGVYALGGFAWGILRKIRGKARK